MDVGNYCYLCLLGGARGPWAPTWGGEGGGISCRHAHSFLCCQTMYERLYHRARRELV